MIRYFFLCLLIIITSSAFAQSLKVYIDKDGNYTDKIKDAKYYALFKKLQDSAYIFRQFDMENELMMQGYYKDSLLTIPSGKFVYYEKPRISNTSTVSNPIDTSSYVKTVGYYLNGLQTGTWTFYLFRNIKDYTCNYVNGKLNGLYTKYMVGHNSCVELEGLVTDDKKEGEWKSYDTLKNVQISRIYSHDALVSQIFHSRGIIPPNNFYQFMSKSLDKIIKKYNNTGLKVTFSVDVDGSVGDVHFDENISASNTKLITDAIAATGKFQPAIYNDKPIKGTYSWTIWKYTHNNGYPNDRIDEYSRHTDLIGRGLNTQGIGTPVVDK